MRTIKITGLILAGMLAATGVAFGHGFGGGGFHGSAGGHFSTGGHFSAGGNHFSGGSHLSGNHFGGHYGWAGNHYHYVGHYAPHGYWHGGHWYGWNRYGDRYWYGGRYWWGYPFAAGIDDYDYYDADGGYIDGQDQTADVTPSPSQSTVAAVQRELTHLGYYHGPIDGLNGPLTEKAIRWFQSVDRLPVTGQIDSQTLEALRIG